MTISAALAATIAVVPATASPPPESSVAPGLDGAAVARAGDAVLADHGPALIPSVSFTAAEKTLLRMIPSRIRRTCVPRRSALARGTVAAVQCRPAARVVRDMAYYLLDGGPADRVFEKRRKDAGVNKGRRCVSGKPGVSYWIGGMPTSELCYRNKDRRANLRFLEPATRCRQLKVAGKTLKTPTVYIAVLGRDRNIAKLARWATDGGHARPSVLTRTIKQPGSRISPACPH
jgi:hypothetical protein